ncbi:efflux RND transporter periplasmic adaptor subunit [Seongchinamella sediminis]|nr:efflux RND transporter periplasmic adaptor subunit [Seongchinamella sediminis]
MVRYLALITVLLGPGSLAQPAPGPVPVRVEQVREQAIQRSLPLTGRIYSRHDAALGLTVPGELDWVLEPGTRVVTGQVIAQLDQRPIVLRRQELVHQVEREKVTTEYLNKELARLRRLQADNNASQRLVDESETNRDVSLLQTQSLQARIEQLDDELRRSQLVAPYAGVIAERHKRGGEYARIGDVIARLVDLNNLELRFQVPVVYLSRIEEGDSVRFMPQGGQLLGEKPPQYEALVRAIIPAADINSQTFEVRADLSEQAAASMVAGQLVNVSVEISGNTPVLQIPRDAIVLRSEGGYVFRIDEDDRAGQVWVEVGEGADDWVSVSGALKAGDWVAIRGVERLQDGQTVQRQR